MPTYQYQCTDCGSALEVRQSFSDDALTVCPECDGRLRKVFNAVGVVFKGSGFYRTDSRAGANGSGTTESTSNGSKTTSDSGSKDSTTKPATKSESSSASTTKTTSAA